MHLTRSRILAVLAVLGVCGLVAASAAQLDVAADDLGAGVDLVSSCSDSVEVEFSDVAYSPAFAGYVVMEVTISGIDAACEGQYIGAGLVDDPDQIGFIIPQAIAGPPDPDLTVVAAAYGPDPGDPMQLIQGVPAEAIDRIGVIITESDFFSG
jgi:hypothetical protein